MLPHLPAASTGVVALRNAMKFEVAIPESGFKKTLKRPDSFCRPFSSSQSARLLFGDDGLGSTLAAPPTQKR